MDPDNHGCGCNFAAGLMHHLVNHVNGLFLHFQKCRLDRDRIARTEFPLVLDVLFHGGHPSSILREPRWMKTQNRQQLPAGFVKLAGVPHDIHVPHMVAMPGIHNAAISDSPFRHVAPPTRFQPSDNELAVRHFMSEGLSCPSPTSPYDIATPRLETTSLRMRSAKL